MKNSIVLLMSLALIAALGVAPAMAAGSAVKAEHSVTYSAKGTRSEAQQGHLSLNGVEVPKCFTRIWLEDKVYCFKQRVHPWGSYGYWPCDPVIPPIPIQNKLTTAERQQGWRLGEAQPEDMPKSWVNVQWKDGSAWAAPEALGKLAEDQGLPVLERLPMEFVPLRKKQ